MRPTSSRSGSIAIDPPRAIWSLAAMRSKTRGPFASRCRRARPRFEDQVHGPIEFDNEHIEPFVILRSDTHPTYHLSVVVDDIDMEVTHVVRGDDHISNTPKQVLLYQAFGMTPPTFAHVPLIMGPDKKRLSKRHGATSVMEYDEAGLPARGDVQFPGAARLGDRERRRAVHGDELIERFTLEGISGGNAVFNTEKLDWFNHQHLLRLPDDELMARLEAWGLKFGADRLWVTRILQLLRPRCKKLTDFADQMAPFFADPTQYDAEGVKKHLSSPDLPAHLLALRDMYATVTPFDEKTLEQSLRALAEQRGIKAAPLIHGTRLAMTGRMTSPGLFEMLVLLGRDRVVTRLSRFIESLR